MAFGERKYLSMARDLVLSARLNNSTRDSEYRFALVTDNPVYFHGLVDDVIPFVAARGNGVSQKLWLDHYAPYEENIFIDSDCLFFGDPANLWTYFEGAPDFGVPGWRYLGTDSKHFSVETLHILMEKFSIERLPEFNGGLYFLRRTEALGDLFELARKIYIQRESFGLLPFKNSPVNDEVILAVAMEICGIPIMPWRDGCCMQTAMAASKGLLSIDVLARRGTHLKRGIKVDPIVIHFKGRGQQSYIYFRERFKVRPLSLTSARLLRIIASARASSRLVLDAATYISRNLL